MISKEEVQRIADLARIRVNAKEVEKLQHDLSEILEYFRVLQEVDVSKVEPMTHSIALENISREDSVRPNSPALIARLLGMFPVVREGFLKVKAIFTQ